jgi:hypothetical protein
MSFTISSPAIEFKNGSNEKSPDACQGFIAHSSAFLERQRERNSIPPVTISVLPGVSVPIVEVESVCIGNDLKIVTDLAPLIRDIPSATRSIHYRINS